jgi:P27 family predicted phage terminase small subunit
MAGRKATPIEIHRTRGTLRKDRHKDTGRPKDTGIPDPPVWLTPGAKEAWDEIVPQLAGRNVVTIADRSALTVLAETFAEWRQLSQDLAAEGLTYACVTEAGATMYRANPKVAMRSDAQRRLTVLLAEFGMTAASRTKVSEVADARPDKKFARLQEKAWNAL